MTPHFEAPDGIAPRANPSLAELRVCGAARPGLSTLRSSSRRPLKRPRRRTSGPSVGTGRAAVGPGPGVPMLAAAARSPSSRPRALRAPGAARPARGPPKATRGRASGGHGHHDPQVVRAQLVNTHCPAQCEASGPCASLLNLRPPRPHMRGLPQQKRQRPQCQWSTGHIRTGHSPPAGPERHSRSQR
jgi:hypothetical protein